MKDFTTIDYLKSGNQRQQQAYKEIKTLKIFEYLTPYDPILTGTIPIDIDLPESDLDIICHCKDHEDFSKRIYEPFADKTAFEMSTKQWNGLICTIVKFKTDNFEIEIFGQDVPTKEQNAFRHMVIEDCILQSKGNEFRSAIRRLKSSGLKTEEAFAQLLGLKGDPYEALLQLEL
ncbi:DUF4269 domain-containing protein [Gaetbulibacter sp. M240]|uniref:DUF4269 domain-containing protein n=1 Tax=Gaetbulibacter sp. M240 TaxID=3126511 RepID=UPI00374F8C0E